jgi:hypothetical protein
MAKIFLLINIAWMKTPMTLENVERVEQAIGNFGEWFRFNGTVWFLHTEMNEYVLYGCLKTILNPEDLFVVTRFDVETFAGWGPSSIDDWIKSQRSQLLLPPS